MKKITLTLVAIACCLGAFAQGQYKKSNACKELFISEMIEGNGQNRALELINPSDTAIDLSNFSIRMFLNGQLTPLIIPLIGTLPPKSTFVIAHPAASNDIKAKADMLHPQLSFDGNDAIVLEKTGGTQIDKIGEIGVDPGNSGWFVPPSGSTKEQTLRRKYPVDKGETDWNQGKNQWTIHPKDSVSNLKQHQNVCVFARDTAVVYNDNGEPVFAARELIVRFDTSAVKRLAVDNLTGADSRNLPYFIKPSAVSAINQKLIGLCDTSVGAINILRIFRQLKTTDTTTVSRLGETIPIPPFWATFILVFPVGTEIGQVADSLNTLFPLIKYTHPNLIVGLTATANDTEYPNQSSLHTTAFYDTAHINIEPAWDLETGKPFVRVGVFDTGIDWVHEDFGDGTASGSKVIDGWNFQDNTPLKSTTTGDNHGHGTSCAGIIGAIRNNNLGIAGIAGGNDMGFPDLSDKGVSLYGMRIFTPFFYNPIDYIADAIITSSIEDITKNYGYGLHIMSNSWRFHESFSAFFTDTNITLLTEAVHFANRAKVTFVAARGNEGVAFTQSYPAIIDDDWVLCVGGTGTDGEYKSTTNGDTWWSATQGWEIDVAAPATTEIIRTVQTGGGYQNFNGTSAATPHVAGVVGLLMSYLNAPTDAYDNLAPEDAEAIVQMTAKDNNIGAPYFLPGVDSLCGFGLLDAGAALQLVDKDSRRLSHYGTDSFPNNKTKVLYSTNDTITILERYENDAGVWFLPGKYVVSTYKIDATVFHNLPVLDSIVAYWPRHSSSNLLPLFDSNNELLPRERITINSVNQGSASLTGYLYEVKDTLGNPLGWWPFDTTLSQAQLTYTILRHNILFSGTKEELYESSWVAIYPNPSGNLQNLLVHTDKPQELDIRLYDITGKLAINVFQGRSNTGKNIFQVSLGKLSVGMYIYMIKRDDGIEHVKVVKQ